MKSHLARAMAILALVLAAAFVVACGDDDDSSSSSGSGGEATAAPAKKIKVGLVTDIGGLNDRSFNQSAYQGLQRAQKELGVDIRVVPSKQNSDYVPNLTSLARQKYDLIVAVGFLMGEATEKVANAFPQTNFAIIDSSQQAMKSKPGNLEGLLFKEQESGYLVGYMAGLYAKDKGGKQVVSSVGGQKIPPVDHYIAGFQAGAKAANPDIKTLNDYSQDFVAPGKCKELALKQIAAGLAGRLPGRRRLRPRRARRGEGEGRPGHRRRRRPGLPGVAHHDLGPQEGRRRGVRHDQERPGRQVRQGHRHDVRRQGRRRRLRQDERRGREVPERGRGVAEKIKSGEIADIPDTVK